MKEWKGESTSREGKLRAFLSSQWVTGFHDVELHDITGQLISIPIIVSNKQVYKNRTACNSGYKAVVALAKEAEDIISDFARCLDDPFENYLEEQRKWAETDAVRDLEYEGDVAVHRLTSRHRNDLIEAARTIVVQDAGTMKRWNAVERKVCEPWKERRHWKLAKYCDRRHRRVLLVYNRHYDSHEEASYELMLGKERERAAKERQERLLKKREERGGFEGEGNKETDVAASVAIGSDDMAAAMQCARQGIVPMEQAMANLEEEEGDDDEDENVALKMDEDNEEEHGSTIESIADEAGGPNWAELNASYDIEGGVEEVKALPIEDGWAKAFIWDKSERPVARFATVNIVTLQSISEGELLLTTHALYFRATGESVSVMTKEPVEKYSTCFEDGADQGNRRWRLNRLTEVHGRRFMLRAQALELFFADAHELFINFNEGGVRERDKFYTKLRQSCRVPMLCSPRSLAPRTVFSKTNLTELWRRRKMSNFDYIMHLNISESIGGTVGVSVDAWL